MPTLFRLLSVIGIAVALAYGAMFAVVTAVRPQPREIQTAIALPQSVDMRTGRSAAEGATSQSAAETLNIQASALVHHHRSRQPAYDR